MIMRSEWDVAVLGAGAAGLAAAERLSRAGCSVLVLEARNRIGGRIWTCAEPSVPVPVELGAEFIHGRSAAIFDLLNKAGAPAIDAQGSHWTVRDGRLQPSEDLFDDVVRLMQRVDELSEEDLSVEEFLSRFASGRSMEHTRQFVRRMVEGFDAADPKRASIRAVADEWGDGGVGSSPQFRPLFGYGALMKWLADALDRERVRLWLESVVQEVRWSKGSVEIRGTSLDGPFSATARRAIVTFPISILTLSPEAPGAVRFDPALDQKRKALEGVALGPVIKVVLHFRNAFWEQLDDCRYRDVYFFHAPEAVFPTFWTAVPVRVPVMTAWVGGPTAQRLAAADRPEILDHVRNSLKMLFGSQYDTHAQLEGAYVHDWQRDPFSRGAYSYVVVGGGEAPKALAEPLEDTLYFAGEATDWEGESGTVGGALQSGARAAKQILCANG